MSFPLRLVREAEQDVVSSALWYYDKIPSLGHSFRNSVNAAFAQIAEQPALYPEVLENVRACKLRRFPFRVFYLIESREIVVVAVMHDRRNPVEWHTRLR